MANEQYLTAQHYLVCTKGAKPVHVSVESHKSVKFSGSLAATSKDVQRKANFVCAGAVAFGAGAVAGVGVGVASFAIAACMGVPGPGWVAAAIIAVVIVAALVLAGSKCAAAAATRFWIPNTTSQCSKLNGTPLLTLSSQMSCPAEGGCITAKATFWEAWGKQTLTNLGHVSNFAFGYLVGRGCSEMVLQSGAAAAGSSTVTEAVGKFGNKFASEFIGTAKENLLQQFTGWKKGGLFCRFMKGFGLYGEIKGHYDIWTDDEKSTWEKIKESGISLILDVFAAKGATTVCFSAGTKVHTQWGLADIEKLEVGVPVLTYNEETGEQEYKKVKKVMRRMTRRMCAMELSNGTTIEVTPEHRFFSNDEWTPIEELNVNDTLQLKDNSIVVIENKIIFPTFVEVYNLEIEDNENYYVTEEGVLVHNGCNNKATVKEVDADTHKVEVTISKSDYPETSQHIEDAIASGKPDIVTIARDKAKQNRAKSLRGVKTKPKLDRDEWPMAMFKEGGKNADIRHIGASDNRGAGSAIGNALKDYPNGTKVKIIIKK
ncbi:MAG: polymorphic toxin-type HINT domain-containing protein [Phocaeicola sp.]|uniref:polymorphic toxin-type HINT domain-containing protein n=1 Tax=Phocaeicola sp. TaxID=2773926 RepID=UPI003FA078F3